MPSAPQIRKRIRSALDEHIIPALQTQIVTQVFAGPPFDFSRIPHQVLQKELLPNSKANPLDVIVSWEKEILTAQRMAQLGFIYSGASDERVGVTRLMAKSMRRRNLPIPDGITAFRVKAPAAFYVPANTPHGGSLSEESLLQQNGPLRLLVLHFTDQEIVLRHYASDEGGTHHLDVSDPTFNRIRKAYISALEKKEFQSAQGQLLLLMHNLNDYLINHSTPVSNSAWPALDGPPISTSSHVSARNIQLCEQTVEYVQFHLHAPISAEVLAKNCCVTTAHLNRVFCKSMGIPLMHFVTQRRLQAAELMLSQGNERIGDIARLTGFASYHSFATVFQRHSGVSPTEYRRASMRRRVDSESNS